MMRPLPLILVVGILVSGCAQHKITWSGATDQAKFARDHRECARESRTSTVMTIGGPPSAFVSAVNVVNVVGAMTEAHVLYHECMQDKGYVRVYSEAELAQNRLGRELFCRRMHMDRFGSLRERDPEQLANYNACMAE